MKKLAIVTNGFLHDFAAGLWLASIVTVALLHDAHPGAEAALAVLSGLERKFFWVSVASMATILATGAGRTFTYVDNWYGQDAEAARRRALVVKHVVLLAAFGAGYAWIWRKVFHA